MIEKLNAFLHHCQTIYKWILFENRTFTWPTSGSRWRTAQGQALGYWRDPPTTARHTCHGNTLHHPRPNAPVSSVSYRYPRFESTIQSFARTSFRIFNQWTMAKSWSTCWRTDRAAAILRPQKCSRISRGPPISVCGCSVRKRFRVNWLIL